MKCHDIPARTLPSPEVLHDVADVLKGCHTKDEVDDRYDDDGSTVFMNVARNGNHNAQQTVSILQIIWNKYREMGCDLRQVLSDTNRAGENAILMAARLYDMYNSETATTTQHSSENDTVCEVFEARHGNEDVVKLILSFYREAYESDNEEDLKAIILKQFQNVQFDRKATRSTDWARINICCQLLGEKEHRTINDDNHSKQTVYRRYYHDTSSDGGKSIALKNDINQATETTDKNPKKRTRHETSPKDTGDSIKKKQKSSSTEIAVVRDETVTNKSENTTEKGVAHPKPKTSRKRRGRKSKQRQKINSERPATNGRNDTIPHEQETPQALEEIPTAPDGALGLQETGNSSNTNGNCATIVSTSPERQPRQAEYAGRKDQTNQVERQEHGDNNDPRRQSLIALATSIHSLTGPLQDSIRNGSSDRVQRKLVKSILKLTKSLRETIRKRKK